jgi:hypothetical protein
MNVEQVERDALLVFFTKKISFKAVSAKKTDKANKSLLNK